MPCQPAQDSPAELTSLLRLVVERFWIVCLCMLLALVGAVFYLKCAARHYEAVATVQVEQEAQSIVKVEQVVKEDLRATEIMNTIVQKLTSHPLLERVLETNGLAKDPTFWGASGPNKPPVSREQLVGRLGSKVKVSLRRNTRLIDVRVTDTDPIHYLVGTPKGRLGQYEKALLEQPWQVVREGVQVKLLPQEKELYVLAQSNARTDKERAMRRRQLKGLVQRLKELQAMELTRDQLLLKLGAAHALYPSGWRLVDIQTPKEKEPVSAQTFIFRLRRDKLRQVRRREGRYLLRSNLSAKNPAKLWQFYIQLTQVEEAFKDLKNDLSVRPIFHQLERRIEAHIFVAFLAYCLHVSLHARLRPLASGLSPRSLIEKFAAIQMLDGIRIANPV